ncbi:tetratricopeptide repeat protein [Spongiactinospora gelatinilytica]|uniref:tetratricopeptide repeat protein n=1 Tax=Spongiactinospora gelatinilytica TaxID=2666298 RepID=UPI000DA7DA92|nr:tetratricopeptide repeat protein [Spongiactinospora gelatinilytica]
MAEEHENRADLSDVSGPIIQARNVTGGIRIYRDGSGEQENNVPRQLPGDVSHFVNRADELSALTALLDTQDGTDQGAAKVIVISGSPGVGKTALALRLAHSIRAHFTAGDLYVNLRGYDDGPPLSPSSVLDRMLRALGVPGGEIPADVEDRSAAFRSVTANRKILFLLDNAVSSTQVRPLLPGSAGPLVIITSRSALPALAVRDGAKRIHLDIFQEGDALALLKTISHGWREDGEADLLELVNLCARLPLALRIAAERAVSRPMMLLTELIDDLKDDSLLWETLSLSDDSASEAVRTVFAWSYRALPEDAARTFRLLGVNPGADVGLTAAAALAGAPVRVTRHALDLLVGAFMVEVPTPGRFRLHDLLKAYAVAEAQATDPRPTASAAIRRLAAWYALTLEQAVKWLAPGDEIRLSIQETEVPAPLQFANSLAAYEWFEVERGNIVATARAALEREEFDSAWCLAMAASPIHMHYFTFDDWALLGEVAVTAARALDDPARHASALTNRGRYLFRRRSLTEARDEFHNALLIREDLGDARAVCESLNLLGLVCLRTRELDDAASYFQRAATGFSELADLRWESLALSNLAEAHLEADAAERALAILSPLPEVFARLNDPAMRGNSLWLIAWARRLSGDLAAAASAINGALGIAEEDGNRMQEGFWQIEAARVHLASGALEKAMECCVVAASLQRQIGDTSREAMALDCTGEVHQALRNFEEAAAFHLQALRMHEAVGDKWLAALALRNLVDCEIGLGRPVEARSLAVRGLELLAAFTDLRAAEARRHFESLAAT